MEDVIINEINKVKLGDVVNINGETFNCAIGTEGFYSFEVQNSDNCWGVFGSNIEELRVGVLEDYYDGLIKSFYIINEGDVE